MPTATGTVLLVQESRFRLLTGDGRGLVFLLAHNAGLEPQDLPALTNRRVRVRYAECDRRHLLAGVARDIQLLGHHAETRP